MNPLNMKKKSTASTAKPKTTFSRAVTPGNINMKIGKACQATTDAAANARTPTKARSSPSITVMG